MLLTLKSWFYSWRQPANIADIHFHSLWQAPTPQGQKTHVIVFTGQKFHLQLVIGQMLISRLWEKPSNLSEFVQSITNQFFSNLAWSKSQGVYYKPTCIHMHFKNFGPSKTFPFSKYTTKISSPRLPVWDTTTIMYITLKTGQVSRHIIHVGNWANNAQLSIQVHYVVSLQDCCLEENSHSTYIS